MTTGRIAFLDGIRGFAAMTVVLCHALQAWLDLGDARSRWLWTGPFAFLTDGEAAVLLFFVLSGVALSWGSFHGGPDPFVGTRTTLRWLVARSLRIYGPFAVTLVLMAIARSAFWDPAPTSPLRSSWFEYFSSIEATRENLLQDLLLPVQYPRLVAQGWSLTEEMRFAFFLPLLLPVAARSTGATLACLVLAAGFGGVSRYVLFFAFGILIAKHWNVLRESLVRRSPAEALLLLVSSLALYSVARWGPWHFPVLTGAIEVVVRLDSLTAAGAALLLVVPLASPAIRAPLESGPAQWLGRVSFSLYLVHLLPVFYLSPRIVRKLNNWGLNDPFAVALVSALGACLASMPLAHCFQRWVEAPCTEGARRILRRGAALG
ncbi:MAG: acyltransferase [Verrucomicrobia bacterium]|nr:acyltransferase [Verrucomicrobiota bacterium]